MKGVTPIISIIILLLIVVALAGAAWFYLSGVTDVYTAKAIDIPVNFPYFNGRNVEIMVRNIGTKTINTSSCYTSGNTVTCGEITITREGGSEVDIGFTADSIPPRQVAEIIDYNCQGGDARYIISSPSSTYQVGVGTGTGCSYNICKDGKFGCVSYWKFDDGSANDTTGRNNGTGYNAPEYVQGFRGGGLYFNETNGVRVNNSISLNITDQISLLAWVNFAKFDGNTNYGKIITKPNIEVGNENPWELYTLDIAIVSVNSTPRFILSAGIPTGQGGVHVEAKNGTYNLTTSQWYHIAGTYNGSLMSLYVNGTLIATAVTNVKIGLNDTALFMGGVDRPSYCGASGCNFHINGIIDEVLIYNRSLPESEIKQLFDSYSMPG